MDASTKLRARRTRTGIQSLWRGALLIAASFLGCGGLVVSGPSQPPAANITVVVAPATASMLLGERQNFSATVSNAENTAVSWSVNGIPGGSAAVGTVDAGGVYTAPQIIMEPPSISLTAASVADSSRSGAAAIAITSSFSLSVSGPVSLSAGATTTYSAALTPAADSNPSRVISWSVAGNGCTGASCGTISSDGVFTAPVIPPSSGSVQIIATPQADPSKAAFIVVSILPVIHVSISPAAVTVALGAAQAFQAIVTGAQDASVTWDVNGIVGGDASIGTIQNSQTDPNHTVYISPQTLMAGRSVIVHARSNAAPGISASAIITFTDAASVTLAPQSATLALGERQTFVVEVGNTPDQNVIWTVNGIAGGNPVAGQICVTGSDPCQPVSSGTGGSVDYIAPAGVPSPNPVTVSVASQEPGAPSASAQITILPHLLVNVQPGNASLAANGQMRFTAKVTGAENQQVIWTVTGAGCANPGDCGGVDSTGFYTAPATVPSPDLIAVVATSLEDESQSGTATLTITSGPAIFSLAPTSAYAGSAGGFTLLVSGGNFSTSNPGPGSTLLVAGSPRTASCASPQQCIASLTAADLAIAGNLPVQVRNPDGSLSNTETFVVLAPGNGTGTIPLAPSAPASAGNDIIVVELSTNGGSGAPGNVSLSIAAIGPYNAATSSCVLGGTPIVIQRPGNGIGTADLCVFSISALDPFFEFTISGSPTPDITVSNREPLGLGMLHLTLQVPATASPGPRTLFVENPEGDKAAGTGAIEVK
jgi:hypothetical protein